MCLTMVGAQLCCLAGASRTLQAFVRARKIFHSSWDVISCVVTGHVGKVGNMKLVRAVVGEVCSNVYELGAM